MRFLVDRNLFSEAASLEHRDLDNFRSSGLKCGDMTTYVYESIPSKKGGKSRYFEFKQRMSDAPLTKHPETGEAIRRVMAGGFGLMSSAKAASKPAKSGGCGPSCGCH